MCRKVAQEGHASCRNAGQSMAIAAWGPIIAMTGQSGAIYVVGACQTQSALASLARPRSVVLSMAFAAPVMAFVTKTPLGQSPVAAASLTEAA